jgi:hypothetical protein
MSQDSYQSDPAGFEVKRSRHRHRRPAGIIELVAPSALLLVCLVSSQRSTARHPKLAVGFLALAAATATLIAVQFIDAILVAS